MSKETRHKYKLLNLLVTQENFIDKDPDDYLYGSLSQPPLKVLNKHDTDDELKWDVACPICHKSINYSELLMIHGKMCCHKCHQKFIEEEND